MKEFDSGQEQDTLVQEEDLLDLNKIMQAFGVSEWKNRGPVDSTALNSLSLQVEI